MVHTNEPAIITSLTDLRAIVGPVGEKVAQKTIDHIDDLCAAFIAKSSYLVMATLGPDGLLDLSPKGDPAGFVEVLDRQTLIIPDRLGNGRFDSYENLIANASVALIFLIPGHNDTLRIAGVGRISRDAAILSRFPVNAKLPRFALIVTVKQAFLHCGKSTVRAGSWRTETWPNKAGVPTLAQAMVAHGELCLNVAEMQEIIEKDGQTRLY